MSGNPEQGTEQEPLTPERTNKIVDKLAASLTNYTSDATTRDRLGAKLTDAKQGLFGGDMTVSVDHGAFGVALKSEYKDGFSQRSIIGRQGGVFDDVVVPDHEGHITNQEALDAFEILSDALYAEMYEQLATASPVQGDLLSALDSLTELGVASPQVADMMRISQPTIELYRKVLSMRSERPGPPDRRGDVDAQVDQTYITNLLEERNHYWQESLNLKKELDRLNGDNATLREENTALNAQVENQRTIPVGESEITEKGMVDRSAANEIFLRLINPRPFMDETERERFGGLVEEVFPGMTDRFMKFHDGQLTNRHTDSTQKEKQDLSAGTEGELDKGAVETIINSIITNGSLDSSQIQVAVYAARHLGINSDLIETLARFLHDEKDEKKVQERYDKQREVGQKQGEIESLKGQLHDSVPREEVRKAFMIILSLLSKEHVTSEDMKRITAIGKHFSSRSDDKTVSELMHEFEDTPGLFKRLTGGSRK